MSKIKIRFVDLDDPEKTTEVETKMEEKRVAERQYDDILAGNKQMAVLGKKVKKNDVSMFQI